MHGLLKTSFYVYFIRQGKCSCLTSRGWGCAVLPYTGKKEDYNQSGLFEILSEKKLALQTSVLLMPLEIKNKIVWRYKIIFDALDNDNVIFFLL